VDHFLLRVGKADNPIVFPKTANYSSSLLFKDPKKGLYIAHNAPGADQFRYSLNFETTYSDWQDYPSEGNITLAPKVWSGTKTQEWSGEHVIVQYWNRMVGSSDHVQHGDIDTTSPPRRFPHFFLHGLFNLYGFDAGYANTMVQDAKDSLWKFNFMGEWPVQIALNAWGMNPDGQPDQTRVYGDIDGDFVLDRIPPLSLIQNLINITDSPVSPYLANQIVLDDGSMRFRVIGVGNRYAQLALYMLFWIVPVLSGAAGVWIFVKSFYRVKRNEIGVTEKRSMVPLAVRRRMKHPGRTVSTQPLTGQSMYGASTANATAEDLPLPTARDGLNLQVEPAEVTQNRRTVLIATMEYDIEDWKIKVKIGGLGVMAQLMGKNLAHQDLVWVIPCVGGIYYPMDTPGQPMVIEILGKEYQIQVQYHVLRNITYVLLDAPIFRQQTQSEPYPPRMDDLDSAIYYSAWNQCIAEAMRRFPVDLYHINDYHGTVAPLHLLPMVIPCVLSLHNAEFQGLWPMRTLPEKEEVCEVYNLDPSIVSKYVQFGEVFSKLTTEDRRTTNVG
jgi:alpha-1,3-glucan synthase